MTADGHTEGGSRVKGRLQWVGAKVELVLYNALYSQACVVQCTRWLNNALYSRAGSFDGTPVSRGFDSCHRQKYY